MSELSNNQLFWNEFSIDDHTLDINLMRKLIDYTDCSDEKHRFFERFNIIEFAIFIKELFTEKFKIFNILHKISNFFSDSYAAIDIVAENTEYGKNETVLTSSKRIALKHELKHFIENLKIKFEDVTDYQEIKVFQKQNFLDYYTEFENLSNLFKKFNVECKSEPLSPLESSEKKSLDMPRKSCISARNSWQDNSKIYQNFNQSQKSVKFS